MGYADKIQDLIQISEDEQNRIKEKVRKATERRKSVLEKVPYGYRFDQSQGMVHDPIPAEYVKFIFEKLAEYTENPPEELVQAIIDSYQERYGRLLSHDEAKWKISFAEMKDYLAKELFLRDMAFQLYDLPQTAEALRKFLLQSFDVENPERLLADYREMIGDETPLSTWERRLERMLDSAYCIGKMTYYSELGEKSIRVTDHHEPIISRELYASVCEKWKREDKRLYKG